MAWFMLIQRDHHPPRLVEVTAFAVTRDYLESWRSFCVAYRLVGTSMEDMRLVGLAVYRNNMTSEDYHHGR